MDFSRRIVLCRRKRNLSQKELAARAAMSPAQLNRYERGRSRPSLQTMERLARALNVRVRDLIW